MSPPVLHALQYGHINDSEFIFKVLETPVTAIKFFGEIVGHTGTMLNRTDFKLLMLL